MSICRQYNDMYFNVHNCIFTYKRKYAYEKISLGNIDINLKTSDAPIHEYLQHLNKILFKNYKMNPNYLQL